MNVRNKVLLMILDGWGHGELKPNNAIYLANTPFIDSLYSKYPNTELITHGEAVGLPDDQMGNSEVGHLNIGAGRVVYQELLRINKAIEHGELKDNPVLQEAFSKTKNNGKALHFLGLVSDGGVHSHIEHLKALCRFATEAGLSKVFVHAITDGRDTDPKSGLGFMEELQQALDGTPVKIASVCGRYYTMDRDKRWERVKKAWDLLVKGEGQHFSNPVQAIIASYHSGITDEFLLPVSIRNEDGSPVAVIEPGDTVLCFNFRTDRCREITRALHQESFPEYQMQPLPLHYVTMTAYDASFKDVQVIFENDNLNNTLGEVLAASGKTQTRIAETEKYPHVTFFFSGGREKEFSGERRVLIPSPKVATYDLKPEMSAPEVTRATIREIKENRPDFVCLNFANADMVGHTGVFEAAKKAVETVDQCVSEIVPVALDLGYYLLITADHGNSDYLVNEDGSPNTAHTKNLVPLFLLGCENRFQLTPGKLGDLAPTILHLMGVDVPKEMTGQSLLILKSVKPQV